MISYTITHKGSDYLLDMPVSTTEMPLAKYVGICIEQEMCALRNETDLITWVRILTWYFDIEESVILDWPIDTVAALYSQLGDCIANHEIRDFLNPENPMQIQYKGDTYTLPPSLMEGYYAQTSTLEYLMCAEATTRAQELNEAAKARWETEGKAEDLQDMVNVTFSMYLGLITAMLLKEGERLPLNAGERDLFIESRMQHFADIPASVGLDAAFFLTGLASGYESIQDAFSFLSHHSLLFIVATQPQTQITKAKPKRIRN
jgi:hypothetical protein